MIDFSPQQRIVLVLLSILLLGGIGLGLRKGNSAPPVTVISSRTALASGTSNAQVLPRRDGATHRSLTAEMPAVVHVAGAVKNPGVYKLQPGQRIVDAIHLAGGPTSSADLDALNLAAKVGDGQQILVPRKNQSMPANRIIASVPRRASSSRTGKAPPASVAVNTATAEQLDTLPGVGPATAQKILDYRAQNGPFQTPDDLLNVKGIGPKKLEKMRPFLIVP